MDPRGLLVVEDTGRWNGESRSTRAVALEQVANRPIIDHVVDALADAGIEEVIVASSTDVAGEVRALLAERERRDGLRWRCVEQDGPVDVAGAIRLAAPLIGEAPCIVHLASGLLGEPLESFLSPLRGPAPDASMIVHQGPAPYGHLGSATRKMLHLAELDPKRAGLGIAGVCLFGAGALEQVAGVEWWRGGDVDLTKVADRITAIGGSLDIRIARFWHAYSGNPVDLLELNRIALDRLESDHRRNGGNGNRIEGRVYIDETASVRSSVIVGPAVIGAGACIDGSYIGPYTAIGAGARVENAEVERSIVAAGAAITHIGCRLAGSVIGRDARVFRDFALPRALRLRVGDGTEVALS